MEPSSNLLSSSCSPKLGSNSPDIEAAALAVRAAVEKLSVPGNVLKDSTALLQLGPARFDRGFALFTSLASPICIERGTGLEIQLCACQEIAAKLPKAERVAVRSSANSEDLEKVSGAGLHDSVLGVALKDQTKLQNAVLQVWSSMFTLRAVQSRHAAGMPLYEGIAMGVLVQPMVSLAGSVYAFIAFSKDAVARNDNAVYIELCIGLGETLASANEPGTPYRLSPGFQNPSMLLLEYFGTEGRQRERRETVRQKSLQERAQDCAEAAASRSGSCVLGKLFFRPPGHARWSQEGPDRLFPGET